MLNSKILAQQSGKKHCRGIGHFLWGANVLYQEEEERTMQSLRHCVDWRIGCDGTISCDKHPDVPVKYPRLPKQNQGQTL